MAENPHTIAAATLPNLRPAARWLMRADRNACLHAMRAGLLAAQQDILAANALDVAQAQAAGTNAALIDRLALNPKRLEQITTSILDVIALPDPVNQVISQWQHRLGMSIQKITVPFGVIGMIYESRPNVTVDAAMLCIKAGSAVLLRGSSSALASNRALVQAMQVGLTNAGFQSDIVTLLDTGLRTEVDAMLQARGQLDLLIPRGGAALIHHVVANARVPVIETGTGVCHLYVHEAADLVSALAILVNGKVQRPGVCNALETLLIDQQVAEEFVAMAAPVMQANHVQLRGCAAFQALWPDCSLATDDDYAAEFLDLILSVKIVPGYEQAVQHIQQFGTQHSEVICTQDQTLAAAFQRDIDAAAVYVNASSRFTDGFEFGFGAEIGISTQKMHARGPMGLAEMLSYKYLVNGTGQVR